MIDYPPFSAVIVYLVNHVGSGTMLTCVGVPLYLFVYREMTRRVTVRHQMVEQQARSLAQGSLGTPSRLPGKDETARLSELLGNVAFQLHAYFERTSVGLAELAGGNFQYRLESGPEDERWSQLTERINAMAAQLERSIKDERNAEKSKNDLITGVSHDLRTPLTSLLGFLEVIQSDRYRDEAELRHYIDIIYKKALTLKKLIDDLFEYTRISGGLPVIKEELDLLGFMRQLAEEYVPELERMTMACRVESDMQRLSVRADGELLARCFSNLLDNAIRYGSGGGAVEIQVSTRSEYACVRVINYGDPISIQDLPYLFERFYRGDTARTSGGSGLGLAIVKSIVQAHSGEVAVQSSHSRTVFEVRLPLEP
ncbi:sensor histidine kinase [Cohnella sp. JJ-181]|uniref:sensor histidine kinase n=1 Tax=Cohnella rhizoplanae TaxID=2974897 RepID=UPI00232BE6CA|nr:HAMP domain-containing sensor histidine kinase [Cohnella sp. JJ-181]